MAAFEYGSCLNRLKEIPYENQNYYNLLPSEEFENNWMTLIPGEETISISLEENELEDFRKTWE